MNVEINEALQGTLTRLAALNNITEEETVMRIVNNILTTEFKKEIYSKIEASPLEDFKTIADTLEAKQTELAAAKQAEVVDSKVEETKP